MSSSSTSTSPWPLNCVSQKKDGSISVEWSNAELTDGILERFVKERLDTLLQHLPEGDSPIECTVDLSCNDLRKPSPLALMLRRLREAPVHITSLRLHKNSYSDVVAAALTEHLYKAAEQERPLMHLHFSGNGLSAAGIRSIVEAAHRCGGYPWDGPELKSLGLDRKRHAFWLRVEQQYPPLDDPAALLDELEGDGWEVCLVGKDVDAPPTAMVQMPLCFCHERGGNGKGSKGGDRKGSAKGAGKWGADHTKGKFADFNGKGKYGNDFKGNHDGKGTHGKDSKGKGKKASFDYDAGSQDWSKGKSKSGGHKGFSGKGASGKSDSTWFDGDHAGRPTADDVEVGKAYAKNKIQGADSKGKGKYSSASGADSKGKGKYSSESGADSKGKGKYSSASGGFSKGDVGKDNGKNASSAGAKSGKSSGKGKNKSKGGDFGKGGSDASEIMEWLKAGREGEEFEYAWKKWCRDHDLSNVTKAQRIESIGEFREAWESGALS